jgi:outer membrane protein TolC
MRRVGSLAAAVCLLFGLTHVACAADVPGVLTLEDVLARVEYHSDYKAWESSLESSTATLQSLLDKHGLALELSGNLLTYSYNLDTESSRLSTGAGLSLSKTNRWGTSVQGRLTPTWDLSKGSAQTSWSLELTQTLWPLPQQGSDQLTLQAAYQTQGVLHRQRDYVVANAQLKIERLYRAAQLAEARVALAEARLGEAIRSLSVLEQKQAMGEAGEADLISGELSVLRAERELEALIASAAAAKANLLKAVDLAGDYQLAPLDLEELPESSGEIDVDALISQAHQHPLVLQYEVELDRAERELEASLAAGKPQASLRVSLGERTAQGGQGGTTFEAAVTIGYPLLDRNQRENTIKALTDSQEKAEDSYASAVENVVSLIKDGAEEIKSLERDERIAFLTLRQAELEWELAQRQYAAGMIESTTLQSAELRLKQAQLDYYESLWNCAWAKRALNLGLVGDLTGIGGQGR